MRALTAATALLAACASEQQPALTVQGTAVYADGTPAANLQFDINLLGSGSGLFPAGVNGCTPGDDGAQALQVVTASTDGRGAFTAQAPLAKFTRATDTTCFMAPEKIANFVRIDLRAQADANQETCAAYCRRQHLEDMCVTSCSSGGQKFVSSSAILGDDIDVQSAAQVDLNFSDLGPALPPDSAPRLPDLLPDGNAIPPSVVLDQVNFPPGDCAVQEACVLAPGPRTVLRFDGDIENLGSDDLRIGNPAGNPLFSFDQCHQHYHLENIMLYELLDGSGQPVVGDTGVVVSRKQGFCIEGVEQVAGGAANVYNCDNQGLAPGWEDIYGASLDCQWLDVTGVPPGDYQLRVTVNPGQLFIESDYTNNTVVVPVSIDPAQPPPGPIP
jgi:hypothetical protein